MSVFYYDDFSTAQDGIRLTEYDTSWIETESRGGHAFIKDNVLTDAGLRFTCNVLVGLNPPSSDYAVEAELARKTLTTRNIYLCVRCSSDGNTYYSFYHQRSGRAMLRKTVNGSSTTLGEVVRGLPENGSEVWRISVKGTNIVCTIDGTTIFDVNDSSITDGFVGLHFYTDPTYDPTTDGPVVKWIKAFTEDTPALQKDIFIGTKRMVDGWANIGGESKKITSIFVNDGGSIKSVGGFI